MPITLTESNAYSSIVPVPIDTEAATSASLIQFAQPLANRTRYLRNILEVTGGKRVFMGSMGMMANLTNTDVGHGDQFLVNDGGSELRGTFSLFTSGGLLFTASDGEFVQDAHASHPAGSKWFHNEFTKLNATIGLAKIVGGKVLSSVIPYGHISSMFIATGQFTATTTFAVDPNHEIFNFTPGACVIGDVLSLDITAAASCGGNFETSVWISLNGGANYFLMSPDTGGGTNPPLYESSNPGHSQAVSLGFSTTAWQNSTGSVRMSLRGCVSTIGTTLTLQLGAGRFKIERP